MAGDSTTLRAQPSRYRRKRMEGNTTSQQSDPPNQQLSPRDVKKPYPPDHRERAGPASGSARRPTPSQSPQSSSHEQSRTLKSPESLGTASKDQRIDSVQPPAEQQLSPSHELPLREPARHRITSPNRTRSVSLPQHMSSEQAQRHAAANAETLPKARDAQQHTAQNIEAYRSTTPTSEAPQARVTMGAQSHPTEAEENARDGHAETSQRGTMMERKEQERLRIQRMKEEWAEADRLKEEELEKKQLEKAEVEKKRKDREAALMSLSTAEHQHIDEQVTDGFHSGAERSGRIGNDAQSAKSSRTAASARTQTSSRYRNGAGRAPPGLQKTPAQPVRTDASQTQPTSDHGSRAKPKEDQRVNAASERSRAATERSRGVTTRSPDVNPPVTTAVNQMIQSGTATPARGNGANAPNSNGQRVRVVVGDSHTLLYVHPTATPLQLIRTAPTMISEPIDPRNSVLFEDFRKCGLSRPLRMYELAKEVLDSWDSVDQHDLILRPSDSQMAMDRNLYPSTAPKDEPPVGASWVLAVSRKKGKWDKVPVTLQDGKLHIPNKKKERNIICDLTVSDVFTLTEKGKGFVKPPKQFTFAIKSMMKVSMFMGDEGYITYFSTNHAPDAAGFYEMVHTWRSWYLYRKNAGANVTSSNGAQSHVDPSSAGLAGVGYPTSGLRGGHGRQPSNDSPFLAKSFKPDLDLDFEAFVVTADEKKSKHVRNASDVPLGAAITVPFNSRGIPSAAEHSAAIHARQLQMRQAAGNAAAPPVSYSRIQHSRNPSKLSTNSQSRPSTSHHTPRRTSSVRQQYMPALHHEISSGRGFIPPASGPLIKYATSPGQPLSGLNRSGSVRTSVDGFLQRNTSVRSSRDGGRAHSGSTSSGGRGLLGDLVPEDGFTGGGLLGSL